MKILLLLLLIGCQSLPVIEPTERLREIDATLATLPDTPENRPVIRTLRAARAEIVKEAQVVKIIEAKNEKLKVAAGNWRSLMWALGAAGLALIGSAGFIVYRKFLGAK